MSVTLSMLTDAFLLKGKSDMLKTHLCHDLSIFIDEEQNIVQELYQHVIGKARDKKNELFPLEKI